MHVTSNRTAQTAGRKESMKKSGAKIIRAVLLCGMLICLAAQPIMAVQCKAETAAAFDRYIGDAERRMRTELNGGPFLFVDALPEKERAEAYAQLRGGTVLVRQLNTKAEGHPIEVPDGLIHDWIGALFVPNASLAQALSTAQDYDDYQNIYKPDVRRSKLLEQDGDKFKVFLQFYRKSLITVVINADFDITYERFGTDRVVSGSHSTRLAEVEILGQGEERELLMDEGHGYLWRLNSYWRLEEKDGGVYIQLESIGLSRGVPAILSWLVNPLLKSIPRGVLTNLLSATRASVIQGRVPTTSGVS